MFLISEVASIVKHQIIKHGSNTTYSFFFSDSWSNTLPALLTLWINPEMVVHATYMYSEWLGYVLQMSSYIPPRQKLQNPNELLHVLLILVPNKWEFSHGPSLNLICSSATATHADPSRCLIKSERQYTAIAVEKQRLTNNHESSCDTSQNTN